MELALAAAKEGAAHGEAPIGAVLTDGQGNVIAISANRVERDHDPTAHAELMVIRAASRLRRDARLPDCTLHVTLEPCAMCAGAIAHARLKKVVFAAYDPKGGGVEHGARVFDRPTCHHRPEVIGGVREADAAVLLKEFFAALR